MIRIILTLLTVFFKISSSIEPKIFDLHETSSEFNNQAQQWSVNNFGPNEKVTSCGTVKLLGGYQASGSLASTSRTFTNLPSHSSIDYRIRIWLIDSYDNEKVRIKFDTITEELWAIRYRDPGSQTPNICGNSSYADAYMTVYGSIPHSANSLAIEISSTLDEDSSNESWGIRELSLILKQSSISTRVKCNIANYISLSDTCRCGDNQFSTTSSSCQACHAACGSCYGSTSGQCYTCTSGYSLQNGYCVQPGSVYWYNNEPVDTCPARTYIKNRVCYDCPANCEICEETKCTKCPTGFSKVDNTTCFPICQGKQKDSLDGRCVTPTYDYTTPDCVQKLSLGILNDASCMIIANRVMDYEITYDTRKHYSSQPQSISMICGNNPQRTLPMSKVGSYVASFTMLLKVAGLTTIKNIDLSSAQSIAEKLAPEVTDSKCNFNPYLSIFQMDTLPFIYLGKFPLSKPNMDFSNMTMTDLYTIYDKAYLEKGLGTLVACGKSCSAILVWRKSVDLPGKPITKTASMLIKFRSSTSSGAVKELYDNANLVFADPRNTDSSYSRREKNNLCYEEQIQGVKERLCADEIHIFKLKS